MSWTCPECSDINKNELIECTCGYKIPPKDNIKTKKEVDGNLDVFIIIAPIAYFAILIIFGSILGSLMLFFFLASPILFFLLVVISVFSIATKKGRISKTSIIGLLLNLAFLIYSIWVLMRGGIT